ncbi:hypothetical protein RKD29_002672 [Streptomyces tendae]
MSQQLFVMLPADEETATAVERLRDRAGSRPRLRSVS